MWISLLDVGNIGFDSFVNCFFIASAKEHPSSYGQSDYDNYRNNDDDQLLLGSFTLLFNLRHCRLGC